MKFYKRSISKRSQYFKRAIQLLTEYRVHGYFHGHDGYHASPADSKIYVALEDENSKDSIQWFISAVCHELAHVICYRNNKYFDYNNFGSKTRLTRKRVRIWIRTGFKAELYADKIGIQLMKKYFPGIRYIGGYNTKDGYDWYQKYYIKDLRKFMNREMTLND